ncbi:hypothetical protein D7X33_38525 [Butyricicoccus sp. 1XD8-22]|nr:hypothetical protein D7X33_38525 [Butyricicoccus sp. 1XD8-22]
MSHDKPAILIINTENGAEYEADELFQAQSIIQQEIREANEKDDYFIPEFIAPVEIKEKLINYTKRVYRFFHNGALD